MSVVVRMEMPENYCEMSVEINGVGDWCPIMAGVCDYNSTKKMPDWCPIICQLPERHGRLIDADEFLKRAIGTKCFGEDDSRILEQLVGESITIAPAERSET